MSCDKYFLVSLPSEDEFCSSAGGRCYMYAVNNDDMCRGEVGGDKQHERVALNRLRVQYCNAPVASSSEAVAAEAAAGRGAESVSVCCNVIASTAAAGEASPTPWLGTKLSGFSA